MSKYINLNRIEFVITDACSGKCKHCSNGELSEKGGSIIEDSAVTAVQRLAENYTITSVMTFGGEPLLFADTVCKIHAAARDCGISKRQLITNGFFSKDSQKINDIAEALCVSGVNDILLSVDVFHQEFIPIEPVMQFAEALLWHNTPSLRVHPVWVVNEVSDNPYNMETRRLLKIFTDKGIRTSTGNNVFPSGSALKHLSEYFAPPEQLDLSAPCGSAPYTSRLDEIDCISINPSGDVCACVALGGNIYKDDVLDIVENYDPYNVPAFRAVMDSGVKELLSYAEAHGVTVDISDCRTACGVCRRVMAALETNGRTCL